MSTVELEIRLRDQTRQALPELPSFDMPCEKKLWTETGEARPSCAQVPTFLLRKRVRTPRTRADRILYCAEHAVAAAMVWEPVR